MSLEPITKEDTVDSWFLRALARRAAEENGELEISGARFNSFV